MSKKVTFAGIVFNGEPFLEPCIQTFLPYGQVVFVEGPTAFYRRKDLTTSSDNTNAVLEKLLGGHTLHGQWAEKDEEAEATARLIPEDTEYVWWIDSDEMYRDADIRRVLQLLETDQYDSISFKANSFFGNFDTILGGFEETFRVRRIFRWQPGATWKSHRPPAVQLPAGAKVGDRDLNHLETDALGLRLFHYSYVYPSQAKAKSEYYADYNPEICIPNYYSTVFLPWARGNAATRRELEVRFKGVHNFTPEYRGDCYPRPFVGKHPEQIEKQLPALRARLIAELK
jgi:hypothetical protein